MHTLHQILKCLLVLLEVIQALRTTTSASGRKVRQKVAPAAGTNTTGLEPFLEGFKTHLFPTFPFIAHTRPSSSAPCSSRPSTARNVSSDQSSPEETVLSLQSTINTLMCHIMINFVTRTTTTTSSAASDNR